MLKYEKKWNPIDTYGTYLFNFFTLFFNFDWSIGKKIPWIFMPQVKVNNSA